MYKSNARKIYRAIKDGDPTPVKKLRVGMIYLHMEKPVYIYEGQFRGIDGISNFWYWRMILEDGSLGERDCGYNKGDFFDYPDDWEIRIHLKV